MSASATPQDSPGVIAPPPLIGLAFVLAGLALDWAWPLPFLPQVAQYAVGGALFAAALAPALWSFVLFRRAGTNVPTYRPTTALVVSGPYRLSRNPIYLAMTTLLLGIALMVDSLWLVGLLPPFALVLRYGVIAREERYLEAKFGDAYRAYKARVRRWL
jgi:protein-S-isoprenylcysteine O-methyltransferase Ste14